MPLGLDGEAELVSQTTSLEKGTFLVMFTDGLTELTLENGELLGDEALGEHVGQLVRSTPACTSAEGSRKLTALLDSLQTGMATDDRTFLIARRV
jgi:serine phosphatase RsbU (regulator of sigma subunit)